MLNFVESKIFRFKIKWKCSWSWKYLDTRYYEDGDLNRYADDIQLRSKNMMSNDIDSADDRKR